MNPKYIFSSQENKCYGYLTKYYHINLKKGVNLYTFKKFGGRQEELTYAFNLEDIDKEISYAGKILRFEDNKKYEEFIKEHNLKISPMYPYKGDRYRIDINVAWEQRPYTFVKDVEGEIWHVRYEIDTFPNALYRQTFGKRSLGFFVKITNRYLTSSKHSLETRRFNTLSEIFETLTPTTAQKAWQFLTEEDAMRFMRGEMPT